MNRRNALRIAAGAIAAGGAGTAVLATAFKPGIKAAPEAKTLPAGNPLPEWKYLPLDPEETARLAYDIYPEGSCMYSVFNSVVSQLAEKVGEPYASFPAHMMKYGHGGIGGYGTTCGTLNGAASLIGLVVEDKGVQNILISEIFQWYERSALPSYLPDNPEVELDAPASVSGSVLCHASNTNWVNTTGFRIDSKERKERCRRMTADLAAHTVSVLNAYYNSAFVAFAHDREEVRTCMTCHGQEGKLGNTSSGMTCSSCHDKSLGHKVFGDIHYKLME